jgi:hypothetical protein
MQITKVISTRFDDIKRRLIKITRFGTVDTQEPLEVSPFGIDSNPVKDMVAVYGQTTGNGDAVIIGYILKDKIAEVGETRLFSTDANGALKIYVHLKNDGKIHFGGEADNLSRHSKMDEALQAFKDKIAVELGLIATGIAAGGGSYTPGTLTIDISAAKIDELKTT